MQNIFFSKDMKSKLPTVLIPNKKPCCFHFRPLCHTISLKTIKTRRLTRTAIEIDAQCTIGSPIHYIKRGKEQLIRTNNKKSHQRIEDRAPSAPSSGTDSEDERGMGRVTGEIGWLGGGERNAPVLPPFLGFISFSRTEREVFAQMPPPDAVTSPLGRWALGHLERRSSGCWLRSSCLARSSRRFGPTAAQRRRRVPNEPNPMLSFIAPFFSLNEDVK